MIYQTGLLRDNASVGEDRKVWDSTDVEPSGQFRIALSVNLNDNGPSGHIGSRTRNLWRCHPAGPAPCSPEVHQHGDAGVGNDFVEQLGINFDRFVLRWHRGLASAAATGIGKM